MDVSIMSIDITVSWDHCLFAICVTFLREAQAYTQTATMEEARPVVQIYRMQLPDQGVADTAHFIHVRIIKPYISWQHNLATNTNKALWI